ncbi:MAG: Ig-like domain-containing protein, partial [Bacteroidetes bacterium]|nr:Ig-like domain-containing protein [Fibrella sp.]
PNKRLGAPLQPGGSYRVVISGDWTDEQGASLGKPTQKTFRTIPRDSLPPVPARWTIRQPQPGSGPLEVAFGEALDYSLLTETLRIVRENGNPVSGRWQPGNDEKRASFTPDAAWQAGRYRLRIENRLEDLAGNNINRPFDRDVTRPGTRVATQRFTEIAFRIPGA